MCTVEHMAVPSFSVVLLFRTKLYSCKTRSSTLISRQTSSTQLCRSHVGRHLRLIDGLRPQSANRHVFDLLDNDEHERDVTSLDFTVVVQDRYE